MLIEEKAKSVIRKHGGVIRTSEAIRSGIHPRTLYKLRDTGEIEQLSRGLYRIADSQMMSNPDLVVAAKRNPNGVVCLISALAYHDITTQIPYSVSIALPPGVKPSTLEYPPVSAYHFSHESMVVGVEEHIIDDVKVKIFSPEKTLADCFKFRNKIGLDIVLEALKFYRNRKKFKQEELLKCAKVCRVQKVMLPYLESII